MKKKQEGGGGIRRRDGYPWTHVGSSLQLAGKRHHDLLTVRSRWWLGLSLHSATMGAILRER